MRAQILRFSPQTSPQLGVFSIEGIFKLFTLELPEPNCIPLGQYLAKRVFKRTTLGGLFIPITFEVIVDGRSGILFHIGNTVADTKGCILTGTGVGPNVLYNSRDGFKEFLEATDSVANFDLSVEHI